MSPTGTGARSTAEQQRERITTHALAVFARNGYHATPVTDVATAAGVSPAYVFRLFPGKTGLFVAAVDRCYQQVAATFRTAAEQCPSTDPGDLLQALSDAYVDLIADRDLIMVQAHAQSACDVPEVRDAVLRGIELVVRTATTETGALPGAVQQFLAYGQLCHLIVQTGLSTVDGSWAETVTAGMRHPS